MLTELKSQGYEFVTVSDLILWDNYTVDANGEQQPMVQSLLSEEEITEAVALYSEELTQAGVTDEQLELVINAVRSGDISQLPEEAQAVIAQVREGLRRGDNPETAAESVPAAGK